ncbi:MAG: MmgE/PrpD family protein [Solirubrobacteraceae bacterium]
MDGYQTALTDWLACAAAGAGERAPRSLLATGDGLLELVAFAGAAGHVLDFDDTFADGVAHVSAATAPAALGLAAALDLTLADALRAYAAGFEAMAALAEASHPALYDAGWHPTTVCGPVGAAVAACELLGLGSAGDPRFDSALAIALLRASGARGAFGSDGKAIQVGLAAAAGVQAALAARAGAIVDFDAAVRGPLGFEAVTGGNWAAPGGDARIEGNWLKLHPSCLGTHAPIDAALEARPTEAAPTNSIEIVVHPVARQAAHVDDVREPLQAKFSLQYCVAFTLLHGAPSVRDFDALDAAGLAAARRVDVGIDPSLPDWGAVLIIDGVERARVACPRGAPERPISPEELAAKVCDLAGGPLLAAVDRLDAPAASVWRAAGLPRSPTTRPEP